MIILVNWTNLCTSVIAGACIHSVGGHDVYLNLGRMSMNCMRVKVLPDSLCPGTGRVFKRVLSFFERLVVPDVFIFLIRTMDFL